MELLSRLPDWLAPLAVPLGYLADAGQRLHWLYLLSALAGAVAVYLLAAPGPRSLRGLLGHCFPAAVWRHRSARLDLLYFLVHRITWTALALPVLAAIALWTANDLRWLAGTWLGLPPLPAAWQAAAPLASALALLLAVDLALFGAHWLMHRVPWLWEFHKVHHAAPVLTPLTAYRFHPVEETLTGVLVSLASGGTYGLLAALWPAQLEPARLLGTAAGTAVFYLAFYNLRHSHVWLPYPRWLSHLLVSPAMHQLHHSSEARHRGRNLGFAFSLWDWLAGSLYVPRGRERFRLGLGGEETAYDSLAALYLRPFGQLRRRQPRAPTGDGEAQKS